MLINRETEKIIFHPPIRIKFYLNKKGGTVVFSAEAVRQMKLKKGDLIEFEIEDEVWLVRKTDNKMGYKLNAAGSRTSEALQIFSNKLVRGFKRTGVFDMEKVTEGKYNSPMYKIIINNKN
jgi:hypothetical protein